MKNITTWSVTTQSIAFGQNGKKQFVSAEPLPELKSDPDQIRRILREQRKRRGVKVSQSVLP